MADTTSPPQSPRTAPTSTRGSIEQALVRLRRLARTLLALDALAIVALALMALAVAAALFDYLFLAPAPLRWTAWGAGVVGAILALRRLLVPSINFRPSLPVLALRVEDSPEGRKAGLHGILASGLEFSRSPQPANPIEAALADSVSRQAMERFSPRLVLPVLRPRRPLTRLGSVALAVAAVIGAWAIWPATVATGAARVLAPWLDVSWPTRTALADATEPGAHDIGRPLALEADLTRTDRARGQTRVWANYRLRVDGQVGPTRRVAMMWQPGQEDEITAQEPSGLTPDAAADAERYAWFHADLAGEAEALASGSRTGAADPAAASRPVEFELEYWFQTADASTDPARVLIVEPPMVVGAALTVDPPAYVNPAAQTDLAYLLGRHDLGTGTDERAKAGPILEGSRIALAVTFNKPLGEEYATPEGVLAGFGLPLAEHNAVVQIDGSTYIITATLAAAQAPVAEAAAPGASAAATATPSIDIAIRVTDRHGLRSQRESMFRLALAVDQDPTAAVTDPATDESVLATAVIDLAGEGADDVGIASVALERQRATSPAGSEGASPEAVGAAQIIAETSPLDAPSRQRTVRTSLDLSTLGLRVGDELWITARATDTYGLGPATLGAEAGGAAPLRHAPARSAPRRLKIISESELIDQIREDLAGIREAAIRLDDAQARLAASVAASGATTDAARGQEGITASIDDQARYLERLAQRLERNRLADESLAGLMEDVAQTLGQASRSSSSATGRMDESLRNQDEAAQEQDGEQQEQERQQAEEDAEQIREDQQAVRDELQRLAAMLDRGSDGWLVRRELERLLEEQRSLQQQTQEAGAQTAGRAADSLTPEERTELERIAQRQLELAQQAQATIDELSQRARDLQQADPAQSSGMRSAAQTGRERQVSENLSEASEQIQRNNTSTAQQQQQEAIDAMEEMLDNLEEGQRGRDQTLQRVLATLVESLDALIASQELELSRLTEARAMERIGNELEVRDAGPPLDASMIALHTNSLGVIDLISTGYPELTGVQRLVTSATTAQSDAIRALRAQPIGFDAAQEGEQTSLTRLREARAEAKRMEEQAAQRENARKRRELRQAYRALLEQQVSLRSDTEPYVGVELTRRQRAEVRTLGESQESLRVGLESVRTATEELADASVFLLAHRRLDTLLTRAATPLREGRAEPPTLTRQQSAVEILQTLVQALDDAQQEPSPFDTGAGSNGGGGGGGSGSGQEPPVIMPIYELRLLRGMQDQALGITRALDADGAAADPDDVEDVAALQRLLAEEAAALIQRMNQDAPANTSPQPGMPPAPQPGTSPGAAP